MNNVDLSGSKELLTKLEKQYSTVFDLSTNQIPDNMGPLSVGLRDLELIKEPNWSSTSKWQPVSLVEQQALQEELHTLEKRGIIRKKDPLRKGFFSQALVFYKPRQTGVRITIDCCRLNTYFQVWTSPLPPVKTVVT